MPTRDLTYKSFLLLIFLVQSFFSYSQVFHLSQNFNSLIGGQIPAGWTENVITGNASIDKWRTDNPCSRSIASPLTNQVLIFDSDCYSQNSISEEVYLESAFINTVGFSIVQIKWDQVFVAANSSVVSLEVYNGSSWVPVYSISAGSTNTPDIDISAHSANRSNFKIRFKWTGSSAGYWMIDNLQIYTFYNNDIEVVQLMAPCHPCGQINDSISVKVKNIGSVSASNFPVTVEIGNSSSITLVSNYTKTLASGAEDTIIFPYTFNTLSGGAIGFKCFSSWSSDQNKINDTLLNQYAIPGTPQVPGLNPGLRCGNGPVGISAIPANSNDLVHWFSQASGGNILGTGNSFVTPYLNGNSIYYVESRRKYTGSLLTQNTGNNGQQGVMFDLSPSRYLQLDSFACILNQAAGNYVIRVYYKSGSYVGSQTNPSAWTVLGDANVYSFGDQRFLNFEPGSLQLLPYHVYGFYISVLSGPVQILNYSNQSSSNIKRSNSDVSITGGHGVNGSFAGSFSNRLWDGMVYYSKVCNSSRIPVTATILPKPSGVSFTSLPGFQGLLKSGSISSPDLVKTGDTLDYSFILPSGFDVNLYGSTWNSYVSFTTLNGNAVSSLYSNYIQPGPSSFPRIRFISGAGFIDSLIQINLTVVSLLNGCDTILTRWIYNVPKPIAGFSHQNVCNGNEVHFTNLSSILRGQLSYFWDFGDGANSGASFPKHKYAAAGSYNAKLIVTSNHGFMDSITKTVIVYENPASNFQTVFACEGDSLAFTNTSVMDPGSDIKWNFGDGDSSLLLNPKHIYQQANTYVVKLTVTSPEGCINSRTKNVQQFPKPVSDFKFTSDCPFNPVKFQNLSIIQSGALGYSWDFGDGNNSAFLNPEHLFAIKGTYQVKLISTSAFGCKDTIIKPVLVEDFPLSSFNLEDVCKGKFVQFVNTTPNISSHNYLLVWNFGDGNGSQQFNPVHSYQNTGIFKVKLIVLDSTGNCKTESEKDIQVFEQPNADFEIDDICLNSQLTLKAKGIINPDWNYQWNLDNESIKTGSDQFYKFQAEGSKNVILSIRTSDGCVDSSVKNIQVYKEPNSDFLIHYSGGRKYQFEPMDKTLVSYKWDFGDAGKSTQMTPEYEYFYNAQFKVILKVTGNGGCESETNKKIDVALSSESLKTERLIIDVHPNPVTDVLILHNSLKYNDLKLDLYTIEGKQISLPTEVVNSGFVFINVSSIEAGVYLLKINIDSELVIKKIIVQ